MNDNEPRQELPKTGDEPTILQTLVTIFVVLPIFIWLVIFCISALMASGALGYIPNPVTTAICLVNPDSYDVCSSGE